MKIGFLTGHAPSVYMFRLDCMKYLQQNGFEVAVLAPEPREEWAQTFEKYGISYVESRTDVWGDECRIYAKNVISLPEINTPRLKLRMLDGSDFEAVFKWGSDPLVNRFMLYPFYKNA